MADVKLNSRCKLCRLIKTDPEIWEQFHRLFFEKGYNKSQAQRWLNKQLKAKYAAKAEDASSAEVPQFNHVNIGRHLDAHISDLDKVKIILARQNPQIEGHSPSFTDEEQEKAQQIADEINSPLVEEYAQWRELLDFSLKAAQMLKKDLQEKSDKNRGLTHADVSNYADSLMKIMNVRQHLIKLQDRERMVSSALYDFTNKVGIGLVDRLQKTSDAIDGMLQAEFPESSIADRAARYIRETLVSDIRTSLEQAVNDISERYDVHF